ncbi:embryonic flower 1 [Perilla frutescens var. frutescens]|nr:embryonic flower 1 [Perilla frutescens var. frutescens]
MKSPALSLSNEDCFSLSRGGIFLGYFEMDKSIVPVEESQWRNDSPASASKSLGSLVQINSIAIDLSCAMQEIESPLHEHFSIRGFVAGMRKKDRKTCLPFASEVVSNDLVDDLPPLSVPKFRWWQCSNCVPEIAAESTALKMLSDRSDAGTSSCQHVGGEKDIVLFSHSIRNIGEGHGSRESIDGEYNDPSIKLKNSDPQCKGYKAATSSKEKTDVRNNECGTSYVYLTEANPIRIEERQDINADVSDAVRIAHENASIGFDEPDNVSSGSDAVGCALPRRRKPKLRSLADIMEDENNSMGEHIKMRSALSSGVQVTSTEKEDDLHRHPELEASADGATVTRSPHRKRKIAAEEDRGPPLGTAKKFKGLIPDSDKRRRILQVSDSDSGGDGSARSDLQLNAKTQQIKPKRNKALEINRKMKQTHGDNRIVPIREVPKMNSMLQENIQKHAALVETNCGSMEHVPPTLGGETEPYLSSLLSGKQVDRMSDKSKSKRPMVEVELSPLMPPRKSFIGDCSVQGKVTLDLSLNSYKDSEIQSNNQISGRQHGGIPDLNESFTEKSSTTQWKQLVTPEDRCSTVHNKLDMTGEGKRQFGVSEPLAVHKIHNNVESGGTSDDIPMDIVELLAKNQRERTLENSRNHLLTSTANNSIKRRSPPVYVHPLTKERTPIFSFPIANSRSGIGVASGETGLGQGILSFPHCQMGIGNVEENQFRLFSSFKPCHPKKTQYSASNSIFSGPRPGEGADLLWPPRRKNAPFHLDVRQNRPIQHNSLDMQSFPDQSYKGKTVSDMNGEVRKAAHDASAVKEGRIGSSTKSAGSLDAYSNDTIPAMQLLSLMDRGVVTGSSLKVGSNSFPDKPFSPCNHHPRLNEKQKDPFINESFFSQGSHNKDFPALLNGVRFPGESSKKSYALGRMPPPRGSTKAFNLDSPANLVIKPSKGSVEMEVCTLNRNPADFSIPDAKNEYTITARDLKARKRIYMKGRSRGVNLEGQKRGRVRKDASGKECTRK